MANTPNYRSDRRWNAVAIFAVSASSLIAFSAFDPVPAGEDPVREVAVGNTVSDVPLPPDAGTEWGNSARVMSCYFSLNTYGR